MPGFRKIYDHTFFEKFVEVNKLCLGLGIVDEVSVSKVTVSIDYITVRYISFSSQPRTHHDT